MLFLLLLLAGCAGKASTPTATPPPTRTSLPTFTPGPSPTPRPTYTPLPTFTPTPDPQALLAGLDELCERAFLAEIGEGGELGAPLITMRKKDYLAAGQEGAGWGYYPLPHLDARYRGDVQLVLCALETREQDRTYTDGTPGYQLVWTVRLVSMPEERVVGETILQGAASPVYVFTSKDPKAIYGKDPHLDLLDFLYARLGLDDVAVIREIPVALEFAGRAMLLLAVRDGTERLTIWGAGSRKQVGSSDEIFKTVHGLAGSPVAAEFAIAGDDGALVLWNLERKSLTTLRSAGEGGDFYELVYSTDGRYLAGVDRDKRDELLVWDVGSGKLLHTLSVPGLSDDIHFSSQGSYVLGVSQAGLFIFDLSSGQQVAAFEGAGVIFSNGKAYAADGSLLWESTPWTPFLTGSLETGVHAEIQNDALVLVDSESGNVKYRLRGHPDEVTVAAFSPGGELLASGDAGGLVILWDVKTGKAVDMLYGHTGGITRLLFSPDGKMLVSGSEDETVRFWNVEH